MNEAAWHSELLILIGRAAIVARRAERRLYQAREIREHPDSIQAREDMAAEAIARLDALIAVSELQGAS